MKKTLSMEDVRHLKHNLDYKEKNDFMENYGWDEDEKLIVEHEHSIETWCEKEISIYGLFTSYKNYPNSLSDLGYAVIIDGKLEYLISIYEPMGYKMNENRGLITFWGHENIIHLWLDNGEFEKYHTR